MMRMPSVKGNYFTLAIIFLQQPKLQSANTMTKVKAQLSVALVQGGHKVKPRNNHS